MEQKYIIGDVIEYDNKIMVIKEPRDRNHFDLFYSKVGVIYCFVDIDKIKPVKIIPKILSANGFKIVRQDESGAIYFKEKLGIDIVASYIRNCYDICIRGNRILKGIEYCHQLQHFFFGLGLNLEMKV